MNYTEFLDLVIQVIGKNTSADNRLVTAAKLGELLRKAAPDVQMRQFGKRALLDVLNDLKGNNRLELTKTSKGALAVSPVGQIAEAPPPVATFNPLRKAIWEAFLFTSPVGQRFIHRSTGSIRSGLDLAPTPADEWVEIIPISSLTQRDWATEFIQQQDRSTLPNSVKYLEAASWHVQHFSKLLKEEDVAVYREWNRFRSSRVSDDVCRWLASQKLPVELAFQQSGVPNPQISTLNDENLSELSLSADETKRIILAALANLPVDQLLEIPIPAGVLFAAMSKTNPN